MSMKLRDLKDAIDAAARFAEGIVLSEAPDVEVWVDGRMYRITGLIQVGPRCDVRISVDDGPADRLAEDPADEWGPGR